MLIAPAALPALWLGAKGQRCQGVRANPARGWGQHGDPGLRTGRLGERGQHAGVEADGDVWCWGAAQGWQGQGAAGQRRCSGPESHGQGPALLPASAPRGARGWGRSLGAASSPPGSGPPEQRQPCAVPGQQRVPLDVTLVLCEPTAAPGLSPRPPSARRGCAHTCVHTHMHSPQPAPAALAPGAGGFLNSKPGGRKTHPEQTWERAPSPRPLRR